jgi:hypothetical protein
MELSDLICGIQFGAEVVYLAHCSNYGATLPEMQARKSYIDTVHCHVSIVQQSCLCKELLHWRGRDS